MQEPYCLAMVLCDSIHQDPATGKFTLLGTFSTIGAREFPAFAQFTIYSAITDGLGIIPIRVRLVDSAADVAGNVVDPVFDEVIGECNFEDPLMVFEMRTLIQTQLPVPGVYHCEIYSGEKLLMSRRMLVLDGSKLNEEQTDDR